MKSRHDRVNFYVYYSAAYSRTRAEQPKIFFDGEVVKFNLKCDPTPTLKELLSALYEIGYDMVVSSLIATVSYVWIGV